MMISSQMKILAVFGWESPTVVVVVSTHTAGLPDAALELLPCSIRRWASASSRLRLGHGSSGTGSCLRRKQMKGEG